MRITYSLMSAILLTSIGLAQSQKLTGLEARWTAKIQIGMSTDEVKKAIGRPQSVEGGFPDSSPSVVFDLPEQKGQLNNSTWFYILAPVSIKVSAPIDTIYIINGDSVTQELFEEYAGSSTVYFRGSELIPFSRGIQLTHLRDPKVHSSGLDTLRTYKKATKPRNLVDCYDDCLTSV